MISTKNVRAFICLGALVAAVGVSGCGSDRITASTDGSNVPINAASQNGSTTVPFTAQQKDAVFRDIEAFFKTQSHTSQVAELDGLFQYLQQHKDVQNLRRGNQSIWAEFPDGQRFCVLDNLGQDTKVPKALAADPSVSAGLEVARKLPGDNSGANAVLINGFHVADAALISVPTILQVSSLLSDHGYNVKSIGGSLQELIAAKDDVDVLLFLGHGGVDPKVKDYVLFSTDFSLGFAGDPTIVPGLVRTINGVGPADLLRVTGITSEVVKSRWKMRSNSLVYFGCCESGSREAIQTLHQALRGNRGPVTIWGWTLDTQVRDIAETAQQVFGTLLSAAPSNSPDTEPEPLNYSEAFVGLDLVRPGKVYNFLSSINEKAQISNLVSSGPPTDDLLIPRIHSAQFLSSNTLELNGNFPHTSGGSGDQPRKAKLLVGKNDPQELPVQSEGDSKLDVTLLLTPPTNPPSRVQVTVDGLKSNRFAVPSGIFQGHLNIHKVFHRQRQLIQDSETIDYVADIGVDLTIPSVNTANGISSTSGSLTSYSISGFRQVTFFPGGILDRPVPIVVRTTASPGHPLDPAASGFLTLGNAASGSLKVSYRFPIKLDFTSVGRPPDIDTGDSGAPTFPVQLVGNNLQVGPSGTQGLETFDGGTATYTITQGQLTKQ